MAITTTSELIINNLCFTSGSGETVNEQLTDCYNQFADVSNRLSPGMSVIKQTIFISALQNAEYLKSKLELMSCAKEFFTEMPPTSVIAQSPENGTLVLELIIIEGLQADHIIHRHNDETSWLIIENSSMKMLVASGVSDDTDAGNILQSSNTAFNTIQKVLSDEGMVFSDIIRQWNYIEQITRIDNTNNSVSQHYQIFNDVRSKFYQQASFKNGFPAATGIGTDCGGIIIDIIAAKFGMDCAAIPIKSPIQLDAYTYSKDVLAENNSMSDFCRTTPKFERAKIFITPLHKWIFISGTAAIVGQKSIPQPSAEVQTEMTIQNILSLISSENLLNHGMHPGEIANINNLRVYIKYSKDILPVKKICNKHFPGIPAVYIVADICRPELLVEIEGQAVIN
jgi:enamine deaminase RidA (YjgF/YER057c/UK114 family)